MRTLWGRVNSSNVMKVIWLLEELHIPYRQVDAGLAFGQVNTPEYKAMNPNSLVPTLEEDGFTLWESHAILRYLAASNAPGHALWPDDLRARANIDRWMDWAQTAVTRPQSTVFQGLVRTPPERRDTGAIEAATHELGRVWGMLDAQLAQHAYVAGPEFTLADIPLAVHVHRWFSFMLPRPELPHLRRWYDALLHNPVYRTHVAKPMT